MHRFTIDIETIIYQHKKLDFKQQTLAEDDHTTIMCTFVLQYKYFGNSYRSIIESVILTAQILYDLCRIVRII